MNDKRKFYITREQANRTLLQWAQIEAELRARKNRLERENAELHRTVDFFSSAIKSGEVWTRTCQEMMPKEEIYKEEQSNEPT